MRLRVSTHEAVTHAMVPHTVHVVVVVTYVAIQVKVAAAGVVTAVSRAAAQRENLPYIAKNLKGRKKS